MSEKTLEQLRLEVNKLQQSKEKLPDKWNPGLEAQLQKAIKVLQAMEAKVEETKAMEAKVEETKAMETTQIKPQVSKSKYIPASGTEHLAHVKVVYGKRFNPHTGAEESKPYIQTFTRAEYMNFEPAAERLGYKIIEVLHKPF